MKKFTIIFCLLFTTIFSGSCKSQDTESKSNEQQATAGETLNVSGNTNSKSEISETPSPIIFIYDASGSMWDQIDGKTKMDIASEVLTGSVNKLSDDQKIGFVAYGHRTKGDCEDVEFLVDIENGSKDLVTQSITKIKPLGSTPLAFSVLQVIEKLRSTNTKATIILLTDGNESCNGNLCDVVKAAKKDGIDFKLHIIGFGLKEGDTEQLQCSATSGDGQYFDAANAAGLSEVLDQATNTTVDDPPGNLSLFTITNGNPIEAYIKFYNSGSTNSIKAVRTYKDTAFVYLPAGSYDIEVKPLDNSDLNIISVKGLEVFEEKITHKTISFDGSKLTVNTLNNGKGWDAVVSIYEKGNTKSVASARTYGKTESFELNPGTYDIELKALIIEGIENVHRIENVEITGTEGKNIEHNFKSGIVLIGAKSGDKLVDATVKFIEVNSNINVASSRTYTKETSNPSKFVLSPGTYEVTINALGDYAGKKETFTITVKEGETIEKIVNF
ncbi:MAG: VWA domain-containing protein [Ignavibacteria bacterium]